MQDNLTGIREQEPIKQGLKHPSSDMSLHQPILIREQDPLKQGLKLTKITSKERALEFVSKSQ